MLGAATSAHAADRSGAGGDAPPAAPAPAEKASASPPPKMELKLPEELTALWPPAKDGDTHPEELNVAPGVKEGWEFSHGRAYIHAPLAKVLEALKDPDVLADRRRVKEWPLLKEAGSPQTPTDFVTRWTVKAVVPVKVDVAWKLGVTSGTAAAPKEVTLTGEKVAGSTFLKLFNFWVVARKVTSLELVDHVKGIQVGWKDAEQTEKDLFASVTARVHGQPLPVYQ